MLDQEIVMAGLLLDESKPLELEHRMDRKKQLQNTFFSRKEPYSFKNVTRDFSISKLLAMGLTFTVGMVLLIALLINSSYQWRHGKIELNQRADQTIDYLGEILVSPLWEVDTDNIKQLAEITMQNELIDFIEIRDENEIILVSMEKQETHHRLLRSRVIKTEGFYIGNVTIGVTTKSLVDELYAFLMTFGITLILIFFTLFIGTRYFIHRFLKTPLSQINDIVSAYAAKDYSAADRVSLPYTEFKPMARVLSEMGRTIQAQLDKIGQAEDLFSRLNETVFRVSYPEGRYLYINASVEKVFGHSIENLTEKDCMTLLKSFIHPDHQEMVDRIWNGIAENVIDPFWEYKIIDGSGNIRWILQSNAPIYDDEGRIIAIDGCCSNITQQKNNEMEKLALEEQLRHSQKAEAIGRLTGGIAHDFNNILGIIIGNLDLAIQEIDKKERVRKKLDAIKVASQRARDVVSQLLNFTRKRDQKREVVDVNDIVNESVQLLRSSFPSHIDIQWHIEKNLPPIAGDATQIHQVLINICTNAMHAMEEKGGTLTIDVDRYRFTDDNITAIHHDKSPIPSKPFDSTGDSLNGMQNRTLRDAADTEFVSLKITDTGMGIDPDILEVIFDPYFSTKSMDKGNGLGLSIVKGIVNNHDGHIFLHSTLGQGSCFTILFPSFEPAQIEDRSPLMNDQVPTGNERILVVDDEPMLAEICSEALTDFGYRPVCYTDPVTALEAFRSTPWKFDLLITDMTMPTLSGNELVEAIHAIRSDLPVIICSGYKSSTMPPDEIDNRGAQAFLQKPFNVDHLIRTTRKVLDENNACLQATQKCS